MRSWIRRKRLPQSSMADPTRWLNWSGGPRTPPLPGCAGTWSGTSRSPTHAPGFTLLAPFGGAPTKHENRDEELATFASYFQGGEATLEHVETHAWGDTVVIVMIERQHGQVGDLPDQDWSLRVTQVYRREGADWLLVHRHADPLVKTIDLPELSALTRR